MSPYRTQVAGGRVGVGLPADLQIAKNLATSFSAVVGVRDIEVELCGDSRAAVLPVILKAPIEE